MLSFTGNYPCSTASFHYAAQKLLPFDRWLFLSLPLGTLNYTNIQMLVAISCGRGVTSTKISWGLHNHQIDSI